MVQGLVIIGACGNAHDVLDIVEAINARQPTWEVVGFLDDGQEPGFHFLGHEILGRLEHAYQLRDCKFISCIGSERVHARLPAILSRLKLLGPRFATLIHPLANVSKLARLGCGVTVSSGCSVGGGSVLGDHVSLSPNVIVGHDSWVDNFSILAPGCIVSGFVEIGAASYLGAGCTVKQRLTIGAGALIGMGAVVTHDVDSGTTVVGIPARPLRMGTNVSRMRP